MLDLQSSVHGRARMQQRGYRDEDVNLILGLATHIADDAFMLTAQDAEREIARRRREIQQLERLSGSKIIVAGGMLITLYHVARKSKRTKIGNHRRQQ